MAAEPLPLDRTDGRSLRSGFLRSAAATPDATALCIGEQEWSYGELEVRARSLAAALIAGVGRPPARVGVLAYRSETAYAGILAALMAGGAFVPLNPRFPAARTRAMIESADLDAIVVEQRHVGTLRDAWPDGPGPPLVLVPDAEESVHHLEASVWGPGEIADVEADPELPATLETEVAYLLFTSGSTGTPKGVPVLHSNVLHFLDVMSERYRFVPADRVSQSFDHTFDLAVFDLFMAWEAGAAVHVLSPIDLVAPTVFITRHELTVWFSVPSIPALMRKKDFLRPDTLPSLRWSLFCGEPLPTETAVAWQEAAPNSVLENLYGPTELTIACFAYRWDPARSPAQCVNGVVPIGRPYPGLAAAVTDETRSLVPDGEQGELLVCGPQTAPGYWRAPDKTAERFLNLRADIAAAEPEAIFYATGDRVQRTEGGDYVYLGRTDHQIKVLGYRVELGEIEAVLRTSPGVVEAVAIGWPVEDGVAQGISAFVSGAGAEAKNVQAAARDRLPPYMTPQRVEIIESMPLNANGKVDRNALTELLARPEDDARG